MAYWLREVHGMENGAQQRWHWMRVVRGSLARALLAIALVAALVGVGCESSSDEPKAAPARPDAISGLEWQAGERYRYRTKVTSQLAVKAGEMMDLALDSTLVLDARSVRDDAVELAARLEQSKFGETDPELRVKYEALGKELEQTFTFTLTKGKLSEVRLPHGWSPFAASISRTLAAALQMAERDGHAGGDTWTVKELDGTGEYDAEYRQVGKDELAKRKVGYGDLPAGSVGLNFNVKLTPKVVSSRGKIFFARNEGGLGTGRARLRRLEYEETIEARLAPTAPLTSHTKIELDLAGSERPAASFDWRQITAATRAMPPDERYGQGAPRGSYDSVRIGDYTLERAIRELEQQARDPKSNLLSRRVHEEPLSEEAREKQEASLLQQSKVFDATAALLRSQPKNVPILVKKIRAGSPAVRAFVDALSSAGTPEAQRALVELMNDRKLTNGLRQAAAFSLTRTESATPASVDALTQHLGNGDFLRIHAHYGLGTIARRLREAGETERARSVAETLVGVLRESTVPGDQAHALRSIANSGHPAAFEAVRPLLKAEEVKVRAAAVDALRLMNHPEVDAIIAERLSNDTSNVKVAALDAISVRKPSDTLAKALDAAAQSPAETTIRTKAIRLMGRWLQQRPEFRPTLEALARDDEREPIRRAARSALGS